MNKTSIEWTDFTWNPIRARNVLANRVGTFCTRVSPGCKNCYASTINRRFGTGLQYDAQELQHHEFFLSEKILKEPIEKRRPARIFVGDMFDLFHEQIPAEFIAEVLRVALKTSRHTFQFLTKRAKRMQQLVNRAQEHWGVQFGPHMHFGVSIEDQKRAEERVPLLQETRAAIRFLSIEPMLEAIDLGHNTPEAGWISYLRGFNGADPAIPRIDWIICGGESGPGARPFDIAWAEAIRDQCKAANVPFFMKQIGARPYASKNSQSFGFGSLVFPNMRTDRKGGNPAEWPENLRIREFPTWQ